MKFLLNMNVPRELGRRLTKAGYECRHVGDIGMAHASDAAIAQEAAAHGEVILTHDLDYTHMLAFSGRTSPSVIILRLRNSHPDNVFARLTATLSEIERGLLEGAVVALEDAAVRVRPLPIAQNG